jgi:hypothetical protein
VHSLATQVRLGPGQVPYPSTAFWPGGQLLVMQTSLVLLRDLIVGPQLEREASAYETQPRSIPLEPRRPAFNHSAGTF